MVTRFDRSALFCAMPTTAERNALLFLAVVALAGGGVRVIGADRFRRELSGAETLTGADTSDRSLGERALAAQIAAVDSARAAKKPRALRTGASSARTSPVHNVTNITEKPRPAGPSEPVDLNKATQAELERLPRVGPALASRIISWREQHGPYRSLDDLRHVRGIGPATVALLAASVTF